MLRNRRTRLTHEGWYFLIVLAFIVVAGSMRQINLMLIMASMMVGAIYFNWHFARAALRRLKIRRRLPAQIGAGDPLVVDIELNSPQRAAGLLITDSIRQVDRTSPAERGANGVVRAVAVAPAVEPGRTAKTQYRVTIEERGQYEFGPIAVETRFPFGLVARQVRFRQSARLLVLPRLGRLTDRWTHLAHAIDYGSQQSAGRQRPTDGEFYGLRDWQPGDSRRLIHWRTSARRGGLMVRQFEQPRSENLTLLVELWQPERPTAADRERVELAVRFAATATVEACRRGGSQLHVIVAGRTFIAHHGGASKSLAREILANLAIADSATSDRRDALFGAVSDSRATAGQVVLLSSRPELAGSQFAAANRFEPMRRRALRALQLAAGSDEFFEFFQP